MLELWPFPVGRRRPSLRIGVPWFAGFCTWVGAGRLAVAHPVLRRPGLAAWIAWMLVGTLVLPAVAALASRLLDVAIEGRAFVVTGVASAVATALAILVLLPDFAAFAFLGAFVVPLVTAAAYALATAWGREAWRDANGR